MASKSTTETAATAETMVSDQILGGLGKPFLEWNARFSPIVWVAGQGSRIAPMSGVDFLNRCTEQVSEFSSLAPQQQDAQVDVA